MVEVNSQKGEIHTISYQILSINNKPIEGKTILCWWKCWLECVILQCWWCRSWCGCKLH